MLSFENPGWFLFLLFLPFLIYLRHFWPSRGSTIQVSFMNWRGPGFTNVITIQRFVSIFLSGAFWAGFSLLIIAQAGPVLVQRERIYLTRGVDIMIVLDVSPSMAAQDVPGQSRFDSAVRTVRSFIQRRRNDPIGLVVYATQAALRVPPTLDYDFLLESLDQAHIGEMGDATALGTAIAMGAMHLSHSTAPHKIMILLTDGEQNAGEILPQTAARLVAGQGIRMYTIGLGSNEQVPLEFTDPVTGQRFRGLYQGYVDHDGLTALASMTGGEHFPAPTPAALDSIFLGIDSMERVESRVRIQVHREPIHRAFLLAGFLLIMADIVLRKLLLKEVV